MLKFLITLLTGASLIGATAFSFYLKAGHDQFSLSNSESLGQFGDYFGGIAGTLLTFLSILLLAYTIHLQSKQISELQHETLKRDLLSHVTKADEEIERWLMRKLSTVGTPSEQVEFNDIVWGISDSSNVSPSEFEAAVARLHRLTCLYCEALGLYRDNIDAYFIYKYHQQKAQSLIDFIKNQSTKNHMTGPSLIFCQMLLNGDRKLHIKPSKH